MGGHNYLYSEEEVNPEKFIASLYNEINEVVSQESNSSDRVSRMLSLFDYYVDITFISRAVLGPIWKSSSKKEKDDFSNALKNYMAKKYSGQFSDFDSGRLKFEDIKKQGSKGFLVDSKIITNSSKSFDVSWQLVIIKAGLKLINIKFEGISMIHSERTEIRNLLKAQSGSVPLLIKALENY